MTITSAIALWARAHRTNARFLIAFFTTLLILAGSALGHLWTTNGLRMGPGVLAGIFATYLLIFRSTRSSPPYELDAPQKF
jgi:hypothetical protein